MIVLYGAIVTVLGVLFGGFLGRAVYAIPRGEYREILFPRCVSCGKELPSRYVIPLVGPFLLRFRCDRCGEKQSVRVLLSEFLFGAVCLLLFLTFGFSYYFFICVVFAGDLLLLSFIDLDIRETPHGLLLVILLLGAMNFAFSFFDFSLTGTLWWEHLIGAFAVSLPLFLLGIFTGGIGGGDVKLMFCMGLFLAYKLTLVAFFFGVVIAAIVAIILRLAFGKSGKYQIPLVPFLSLGAAIALLWGWKIVEAIF